MDTEPIFEVSMRADPERAAPLRQGLRDATQGLLDDDAVDNLLLAATEGFANVVKHAYPDGGSGLCSIRLFHHPEWLELVLEDEGRSFDPARAARLYDEDESGRGFQLIRALMDGLEVSVTPTGGACLRMRLTLEPRALTDVHQLHDWGPMRAVVNNPSRQRLADDARRAATRHAMQAPSEEAGEETGSGRA